MIAKKVGDPSVEFLVADRRLLDKLYLAEQTIKGTTGLGDITSHIKGKDSGIDTGPNERGHRVSQRFFIPELQEQAPSLPR